MGFTLIVWLNLLTSHIFSGAAKVCHGLLRGTKTCHRKLFKTVGKLWEALGHVSCLKTVIKNTFLLLKIEKEVLLYCAILNLKPN